MTNRGPMMRKSPNNSPEVIDFQVAMAIKRIKGLPHAQLQEAVHFIEYLTLQTEGKLTCRV